MVDNPAVRVRREPPAFRAATVRSVVARSPHLLRVSLEGPELVGLTVDAPAASVRLLLPEPGAGELEVPTWTGNEFLLADGRRPVIRTLTPVGADPATGRVDVDVVLHEGGHASAWASAAEAGSPLALSGPGRGYEIDPTATRFLIGGDESAIPAIEQILAAMPPGAEATAFIEIASPTARLELDLHPGAHLTWCDRPARQPAGATIEAAVRASPIGPDTRIWIAGEASSVQRIRLHLAEDRNVDRSRTVVRGYWKHGRSEA